MREENAFAINGFIGVLLVVLFAGAAVYFVSIENIFLVILFAFIAAILFTGITIVQPNQGKVITFLENTWVPFATAGYF